MRTIFKLSFCFLILFTFSCETDQHGDLESPIVDESMTEQNVILISRSQVTQSQYEKVYPSVTLLEQIKQYLISDADFALDYEENLSQLGNIMWSYASLDVGNESNYVVSLPLKRNNKITGLILVQAHENQMSYAFADREILDYHVQNTDVADADVVTKYCIKKVNSLEMRRNGNLYHDYNNWVNASTSINFQEDVIEPRTIVIETYEWVHTGEYETFIIDGVVYEDWPVYVEVRSVESFPCIDSGSGGPTVRPSRLPRIPDDFPSGNGSTDGTDTNDEPTKVDVIDGPCSEVLSEEVKDKIDAMAQTLLPCDESLSAADYILGNLSNSCEEHLNNVDLVNEDTTGSTDGAGSLNELGDVVVGDVVITKEECELAFQNTNLGGHANIFISTALKEKCPLFACIWNNMMDGGLSTDFVCDLSSEILDQSGIDLTITATNFDNNDNDPNATAATIFQTNENLVIEVNTTKCENANPVDIFETLQHELIHVKLKRDLLANYGFDLTDQSTYLELLEQMALERYGLDATVDEHQILLNDYVSDAVFSLIEMNGGDESHYEIFEAIVLNGMPTEFLIAAGEDLTELEGRIINAIEYLNNPDNLINNSLITCEP